MPSWHLLRRVWPRPRRKRKKCDSSTTEISSSDAYGVAYIVLNAVVESSDAFTPLKSAASAVRCILDHSQRIKSNRNEADELAQRALYILYELNRLSSESTESLHFDQPLPVSSFTELLYEISTTMEVILKASFVKRSISVYRHARLLQDLKDRMQAMELDILILSSKRQHQRLKKIDNDLKVLPAIQSALAHHAEAQRRRSVILHISEVGLFMWPVRPFEEDSILPMALGIHNGRQWAGA